MEYTERDEFGRFTKIAEKDPIHSGHSVCNICGKDMPKCWDVVCSRCHRTFCYDCAIVINEYWVCKHCFFEVIPPHPL